ncbi:MAG: hypothetical protein RIQ60_3072 [Pseudomonadota bacterium]
MHLLLSPLTWVIFSTLLLQSRALRRRAPLRLILLSGLGAGLLLLTPLGANALVGWLEGQARRAQLERCDGLATGPDASRAAAAAAARHTTSGPRSDIPAPPAASPVTAIVLSGGFDRGARGVQDIGALTRTSQARALHAATLHRLGLAQQLLVSGGSKEGVDEASVMAALLEQLGVPEPLIRLETRSRSTWENASFVAAMLTQDGRTGPGATVTPAAAATAPGRKSLLLVTSGLHMPRALLAFDAVGLQTCPAPTHWIHLPLQASPGYFLPQSSALAKAEEALHELVGLAAYSVKRSRSAP